jgi:DNA repair protein RadC
MFVVWEIKCIFEVSFTNSKHIMQHEFYNVSEVEISYKNKVKPSERPQIESSRDAETIFRNCWDANKIGYVEHVNLLLLNRANKVLGIVNLASGGTSACVVDPKLVFQAALKANAAAIILAHNHPSGELTPSTADINLTQKIKEGGKFLDLPLLDHVILAPNYGYYSFADNGQI